MKLTYVRSPACGQGNGGYGKRQFNILFFKIQTIWQHLTGIFKVSGEELPTRTKPTNDTHKADSRHAQNQLTTHTKRTHDTHKPKLPTRTAS
jgi:hypothetical protein